MKIKGAIKSAIQIISGHTAFKWRRRPNGLYCFNYHRIGNAAEAEFDPNLFSCSEERLSQHIGFIQQNFDIISVDELIALQLRQEKITSRLAILTFDDGYIDNYQLAYPQLKSAGVCAAFFVPTNYIDTPEIPWWDEVGWIVRHAKARTVKLSHWQQTINIADGSIRERVRRLLQAVKQDNNISMLAKLAELKQNLGLDGARMTQPSELFINWTQLKEMADHGMHIGSHTLSHNILSHLTVEQQLSELVQSKQRLEAMLERPITSVAYPVGGKDTFTLETQRLAQQAGYKLAFSFVTGINTEINLANLYQLQRLPVDDNTSNWQLMQLLNKSFSAWGTK
jgi:peptidoglycan/xylan/chitin deacetylase (PgdA/CDA1 family)